VEGDSTFRTIVRPDGRIRQKHAHQCQKRDNDSKDKDNDSERLYDMVRSISGMYPTTD